MLTIGQSYLLPVVKAGDHGVFLDAQNLGEVFLPKRHAPNGVEVGDEIRVFLYLDSDDNPIATTRKAKAKVGEFAYLTVKAKSPVGAFLDWGLEKDVLVPFAEQHRPMEVGRGYIVYLYIDKIDGRIVASSKIDKFLKDETDGEYTPQQSVKLIVANSTDLGFKAIVDNRYWGVIYKSDVFERLSFGQYKRGFIKHVRPDGRLDISLQGGQETRDKNALAIELYLLKNGGYAGVHDKSDPALIKQVFGMSKGAFKKTLGSLYKKRVITIEADGIRLVNQPQKGED